MNSSTLIQVSPEELAEIVARKLMEQESGRKEALQIGVLNRLKLVTIDQVAALANVSVTTARKWAVASYFKTHPTKRKERYDLREVLEYVAGREDRRGKFPK